MTKARNIADLGSNDVLDTSSSGIDVTGSVSADGATFDGYVTVNDSVDLNGTLFPNSVFMADSQAIVFGSDSDAELSWAGSYLNLNTKGNDIRIMDGLDTKVIWDASTERLGIGTATPQGQIAVSNAATTDVMEIDTAPGFSRFMSLDRTTGDEKYLQIRAKSIGFALDSGTDSIKFDSSGNVGIGVSSPLSKLHVSGSGTVNHIVTSTNNRAAVALQHAGTTVGAMYTDTNALVFGYGAAFASNEVMRIDSSGNIGIHTNAAPNAPLEIKGTASAPAELRLSAPTTNETDSGTITFSENGTDRNFQLVYDGSSGMGGDGALRFYGTNQTNEMLSVSRDGHVNIPSGRLGINVATGSTPSAALDVNGGIDVSGNVELNSSNDLKINNNGSYIYLGQNSGSVGYIKNTAHGTTTTGQMTLGSDNRIDFVETDADNLTAYFEANNGRFYAAGYNTISDQSVKTNIATITDAISKVTAMRGCTYERTDHHDSVEDIPEAGVIAQEVEAVFPIAVGNSDIDGGRKFVNYTGLVGLLIEAVKDQQTVIDDLKSRIEALEA